MAHYGCGMKYNDALEFRWMDKKTTENVLLETVAETEASNSRTDQAGS